MASRKGIAAIGLFVSAGLVLSACGSSGSDSGKSTADAGKSGDVNYVTAYGGEPQNPLLPANTNENIGGRVVDLLYSALLTYKPDGTVVNEDAESIKPNADLTVYTIKLKDGRTFSNGEKITASSYVDAWNFGALATNAQLSASWFEKIVGFKDVNPSVPEGADKDAEPPAPTAKTMSGLKVIDDKTFQVTLNEPSGDFPLSLGYVAFAPLPKDALKDPKKQGESPIGSGPYKLADAKAWKHDEQITLVKNDKYKGEREPKNEGIKFAFYLELDAAYNDLQSDQLDVMETIPATSLASYKSDLGDRSVNKPMAGNGNITIPVNLPHFGMDEEGRLRRAAISRSIDRATIDKQIFQGTRTPMTDFTSSAVPGYVKDFKGNEVLTYNEDEAKKLWEQADAISPWSGKFEIAYNSDGGHKEWVDAVSNSISKHLGIDASGKPFPTFAETRTEITNRTIGSAFRAGWQADYPSAVNFLQPVVATGGSANDGDYSNPEVDALIAKAATYEDPADAKGDIEKAEEILAKDLPFIPLFYYNVTGGWSNNVDHVQFDWKGLPSYYLITKK